MAADDFNRQTRRRGLAAYSPRCRRAHLVTLFVTLSYGAPRKRPPARFPRLHDDALAFTAPRLLRAFCSGSSPPTYDVITVTL